MQKLSLTAALLLAATFFLNSAEAQPLNRDRFRPDHHSGRFVTKEFVINYWGQQFDSRNAEPVRLLQDLVRSGQVSSRERELFNRGEVELVSAQVFAKSRAGFAQMSLLVGDEESREQRVDGREWDFNSDASFTYSEIWFSNPNRRNYSPAPWQLKLWGPQGRYAVRIDQVILEVRLPQSSGNHPPHRPLPPPPPPQQDLVTIFCESRGGALRTECVVPGIVDSASVARELSFSRCEPNGRRNWGVAQDGRAIWVQQGCRAEFSVRLVRRW